jgi:hypothetical protein
MSAMTRHCCGVASCADSALRDRAHLTRCKPDVDREYRQADRAERHEAQFNLAAQHPLAQQ